MLNRKQIKIVIFTRKLNNVMGGLERQILAIAQMLKAKEFDVKIVSLDTGEVTFFYNNEARDIQIIPIGIGNPDNKASLSERILRQKKMFLILKELKPDLGIAFMYGGFLMSRLSLWLIKKPLIMSERNSPEMYSLTRIKKYRQVLYFSMLFTDKITVQFDSYIKKYPRFLRKKIVSIPNTIHEIKIAKILRKDKIRFVYAGRFSFQKGILGLIYAFHEFGKDKSDVELKIYGEGELEREIQDTILRLNLQDKIQVLKPETIDNILRSADVLCIPSIWEGFPNVLAEALKYGVPALGFSDCDGVSNLIKDNLNGWLEPSDSSNEALQKLLNRSYDDVKNNRFSSEQVSQSMIRFNDEDISNNWQLTIEECLKDRNRADLG